MLSTPTQDKLRSLKLRGMLKALEEPPQGTLFLLVAHRPGRLLPTIRSRCRILRFNPLSDAEVTKTLADSPADGATRAAAVPHRAGEWAWITSGCQASQTASTVSASAAISRHSRRPGPPLALPEVR